MHKRIIALLLIALICISVSGCRQINFRQIINDVFYDETVEETFETESKTDYTAVKNGIVLSPYYESIDITNCYDTLDTDSERKCYNEIAKHITNITSKTVDKYYAIEEFKILTTEQLPEAAGLARGVFDYCLRNSINNPKMVQAFEQYSHQDYLKHMMEENYLVMWGAYEQGTIVGMSAMQTEGHITMLYVHPMYQRRGIGKKLLEEMRKYAKMRCARAKALIQTS